MPKLVSEFFTDFLRGRSERGVGRVGVGGLAAGAGDLALANANGSQLVCGAGGEGLAVLLRLLRMVLS